MRASSVRLCTCELPNSDSENSYIAALCAASPASPSPPKLLRFGTFVFKPADPRGCSRVILLLLRQPPCTKSLESSCSARTDYDHATAIVLRAAVHSTTASTRTRDRLRQIRGAVVVARRRAVLESAQLGLLGGVHVLLQLPHAQPRNHPGRPTLSLDDEGSTLGQPSRALKSLLRPSSVPQVVSSLLLVFYNTRTPTYYPHL